MFLPRYLRLCKYMPQAVTEDLLRNHERRVQSLCGDEHEPG